MIEVVACRLCSFVYPFVYWFTQVRSLQREQTEFSLSQYVHITTSVWKQCSYHTTIYAVTKPYFKKQLCIYETSKILSKCFSISSKCTNYSCPCLGTYSTWQTNDSHSVAQRLLWVLKIPEGFSCHKSHHRDKASSTFLVALSQYWVQPI